MHQHLIVKAAVGEVTGLGTFTALAATWDKIAAARGSSAAHSPRRLRPGSRAASRFRFIGTTGARPRT